MCDIHSPQVVFAWQCFDMNDIHIRVRGRSRKSRARGFTAVELMVVLIVAVSAMALGGSAFNDYVDGLEYQSAADHAKIVQEATRSYIKDNFAAVQGAATSAIPATITTTMLKNTKYLSASVDARNVFGQSYSIKVLQPVPDRLDVLIATTGGSDIKELGLRRVAQMIGAEGGYVSETAPTTATGSYGGWSIPLTAAPGNAFGLNPGGGHIALSMFMMNAALGGDYVYRNAVPGHPELNTMTAPLTVPKVTPTAIVVEDTPCSDPKGTIATDALGNLFVCK